ncbi:MAG TPA: hypothetical protein VJ890_27105 [Vineibacter sp.]|nr:hypothetical protein [Vineibacter sp.]
MRRTLFLSFVMLLGFSGAAGAQIVADVFKQAGVLGTWALNCASPPQGGNTYSIYANHLDGSVSLTYDNGPTSQSTVYTILSAELRGPGRVFYLQENQRDQRRLEIEVLRVDRRIQVQSSRRTTGEVLVKDGKFNDGVASPWQLRCVD